MVSAAEASAERGWGFKSIVDAINAMFGDLYTAIAGQTVSAGAVTSIVRSALLSTPWRPNRTLLDCRTVC